MNSVDCLIGLVLLQLIILLGWFYFIAIFGLFLFVMFWREGEKVQWWKGSQLCFLLYYATVLIKPLMEAYLQYLAGQLHQSVFTPSL